MACGTWAEGEGVQPLPGRLIATTRGDRDGNPAVAGSPDAAVATFGRLRWAGSRGVAKAYCRITESKPMITKHDLSKVVGFGAVLAVVLPAIVGQVAQARWLTTGSRGTTLSDMTCGAPASRYINTKDIT